MDFNLTLIGQTISMIVFVWIAMKWIWPMFMEVIEKRRKEIADGIAAGEKGQKELAEARHSSEAILADARQKAIQVTDLANKRGNDLVAEAKNPATASYVPGGAVLQDTDGWDYTLGTCSDVACHAGTSTTSGVVPIPGVDFPFVGYPIVYPPFTLTRAPS